MATSTVPITWWNTSDAEFRAWGLAIHTAILACGLTAAADTGQIDFTTVSKPGAINTVAGYKVYTFNGGYKLRVNFGSGANLASGGGASAVFPGVQFQVGTGTDGAGTLTGNVSTTLKFEPAAAASSGACTCYFSGNGGDTLAIAMLPDVAGGVVGFCITFGRSRNSSGVLTSEYLHIVSMGQYSDFSSNTSRISRSQQIVFSAPNGGCLPVQGRVDGDYFTLWPPVFGSCLLTLTATLRTAGVPRSMSGPKGLGIQPIFPFAGYPDNWCGDVAYYFIRDVPGGSAVPLNLYGTQRNFLCIGGVNNNLTNSATGEAYSLAIPWY
jgi:hypothetical protein